MLILMGMEARQIMKCASTSIKSETVEILRNPISILLTHVVQYLSTPRVEWRPRIIKATFHPIHVRDVILDHYHFDM